MEADLALVDEEPPQLVIRRTQLEQYGLFGLSVTGRCPFVEPEFPPSWPPGPERAIRRPTANSKIKSRKALKLLMRECSLPASAGRNRGLDLAPACQLLS